MVLHAPLEVVLLGVLVSTIGLKLVQASDASVEDEVRTLKEKMTQVEAQLSVLDELGSTLVKKISKIEHTMSKLEKDSVLNENVQNLNKTVGDLQQTLGNYSSQIKELNLQFDSLSCTGEPPLQENGKAVDFKRRPGSIVRYECDRNFVLTGSSGVHCKLGKWEGQPPICSFFDTSFTLVAYKHVNITCYSDTNYQKIKFSRVVDTGSGGSLPSDIKTYTQGKEAILEFPGTKDMDRFGVFECRYDDEQGPMDAIIPFQFPTRMHFKEGCIVANIGDSVVFETLLTFTLESPVIWLHNGGVIRRSFQNNTLKMEIPSVQPSHAGVYECYLERGRGRTYFQTFGRLIVRKCKANHYGKDCEKTCPPCYNGGICHDVRGVCVCPPGFTGLSCEVACEEGHFGADCSKSCPQSNCRDFRFCKPDPYGCSCAPGYMGIRCGETCGSGWYGADCKQRCHCALGPSDCNRHTGACPGGCIPGRMGESCQIEGIGNLSNFLVSA